MKKNTQCYKAAVQERVKQLFGDIDKLNADEEKKYGNADLPERSETGNITSQEIQLTFIS